MSAMFVTTFINDLELKLIVSQQPRGPGRTRTSALTVVLTPLLFQVTRPELELRLPWRF